MTLMMLDDSEQRTVMCSIALNAHLTLLGLNAQLNCLYIEPSHADILLSVII